MFLLHICVQVSEGEAGQAARVLKAAMEDTRLSVPTPVRLKMGPSWGELEQLNLCSRCIALNPTTTRVLT